MKSHLYNLLNKIKNPNIMVIGDMILDHYIWGEVSRISPEAPVQIFEVGSDEYKAGGAGNVAVNLRALGAQAYCCGVSGGSIFQGLLEKLGVNTCGLISDDGRPGIIKTRIMAQGQQLIRIDRESKESIGVDLQDKLFERFMEILELCEVVLISDYGKGTLPDRILSWIMEECRRLNKITIIDPARDRDWDLYSGCTVLKPNLLEASIAVGYEIGEDQLVEAGTELQAIYQANYVVITQGGNGVSVFENGKEPIHIAGLDRSVYDVTGAGDVVLGALGYVLAGDGVIEDAAKIANIAGGLAVEKLGVVPITKDKILKELQ